MDADQQALDGMLKALADPTRLRIVGLLGYGEICVCHIHTSLGIPQSKASRHLAYLRRNGVVQASKRGLWVYYRLAAQPDAPAQALLDTARLCASQLAVSRLDTERLTAQTGCCPYPSGDTETAACAGQTAP